MKEIRYRDGKYFLYDGVEESEISESSVMMLLRTHIFEFGNLNFDYTELKQKMNKYALDKKKENLVLKEKYGKPVFKKEYMDEISHEVMYIQFVSNSVKGRILDNCYSVEEDANRVIFHSKKSKFYLPEDSREFFLGFKSVKCLDLSLLDSSNVIFMDSFLEDCVELEDIEFKGFNVEKVDTMKRMFYNDVSLKKLNLSYFRTPKLKRTSYMLANCVRLKEVNLVQMDTSSVVDYECMFKDCKRLRSVKAHFDYSAGKNTREMYYNCKSLEMLNADIDLSNLENGSNMFFACNSLNNVGTVYNLEESQKSSVLNNCKYFKNKDGSLKYII